MEIQTYSIVIGNEACNAGCPYCVSKMTPDLVDKKIDVNWRNFDIASRYAKDKGVSTVLLTGKGEPTLFPDLITSYMVNLEKYGFPFIELQTNGIELAENLGYEKHLRDWYRFGLTTIAVSIVHYEAEKNRQIYLPNRDKYIDLENLVQKLHSHKFSVRLSCTMIKDYIDDTEDIENLIDFAKKNEVEQLTVRPVRRPKSSRNTEISDWVDQHAVGTSEIKNYLDNNAAKLMELAHGAVVYDLNGQNICLSDALTIEPDSENVRQLIFFPDGHLRYDWQYKGAILL